MKRAILPSVLAVVLAFAALAAFAAAPPAGGTSPAHCASSPLWASADAVPQPTFLTACSATLDCICGGSTVTISCTGTTSCMTGSRWVECDGERERCPPITSCPH